MKKLILLIFLILSIGVFAFTYDPLQANYEVLGTIHTPIGENWHCDLNWQGSQAQDIVVLSDNLPYWMYIDNDSNTLGGTSQDPDIYYIDLKLARITDPNNTWIADYGTVVVKVEEWPDRPFWDKIGDIFR